MVGRWSNNNHEFDIFFYFIFFKLAIHFAKDVAFKSHDAKTNIEGRKKLQKVEHRTDKD